MTDYPYTYTLTPEPSPEAMRQARREALTRTSLDSKAARASWIVSRAHEIDRAIACEDELRRLALRTKGGCMADWTCEKHQYTAAPPCPQCNYVAINGPGRPMEVYRWMPHLGGWVFRGVRG